MWGLRLWDRVLLLLWQWLVFDLPLLLVMGSRYWLPRRTTSLRVRLLCKLASFLKFCNYNPPLARALPDWSNEEGPGVSRFPSALGHCWKLSFQLECSLNWSGPYLTYFSEWISILVVIFFRFLPWNCITLSETAVFPVQWLGWVVPMALSSHCRFNCKLSGLFIVLWSICLDSVMS